MAMTGIVTRFAPSPTGRLHRGHAYSAVIAHDFARAAGGHFLLRIEDIDGTRSRAEHVRGIIQDLAWLGLNWDGPPLIQSQRGHAHAAALDRLKAMGLVYPCFCTRADIAAAATAPHGPAGALYPGTCRALADPDPARPHAWRLNMGRALSLVDAPLTFRDDHAGTVIANPAAHGDVVLARKDAPSSYHLASVVDDAASGVTHVVRGRDLLDATHVHRLLQALLGLPVPQYRHHALIAGPDGRRLAKRDGAATLADLRDGGADPALLLAELRALAAAAEAPTWHP